jgi:hypothetical protein
MSMHEKERGVIIVVHSLHQEEQHREGEIWMSSEFGPSIALGIHEHARDFWRIRAAKQKKQVLADSVLHEHTALTQYMQWHNVLGVRLPCFLRGSENSVACKCMK